MRRIGVGLLAIACVIVGLTQPVGASARRGRLESLAQAQTQLLLKNYHGDQVTSPAECNDGQRPRGTRGVFLLPTLSFAPGHASLRCEVKTRSVLLDLGGGVLTEDNNTDQPYTTADGTTLPFTPDNLEQICADVLVQYYPEQAGVATIDGEAIEGAAVSTAAFEVEVNEGTPLYAESVELGHPGTLAAAYCGWKAVLHLHPGEHVITVDLSTVLPDTILTYDVTVR